MKAGLQKLKNNVKQAVSTLPPKSKADLYFEKRKNSLKLGMQGEQKKFKEAIRKCDEFYEENAIGEDYYSFHKAHHKYLSWSADYIHFRGFQQLLAGADRERDIYKQDLQAMDTLKFILEHHEELGLDFTINESLRLVNRIKKRDESTIKEYDEMVPQIEQQVEDDKYFEKANYFQDVDTLGYKDLSWKKVLNYMCKIETNNGPVKPKD